MALYIDLKAECNKRFAGCCVLTTHKKLKYSQLFYINNIIKYSNTDFQIQGYLFLENLGILNYEINSNEWTIDWNYPFQVGYYILGSNFIFLERNPVRQQKIGANEENTTIYIINDINIIKHPLYVKSFLNIKPVVYHHSLKNSSEFLVQQNRGCAVASKSFIMFRLPKWWRPTKSKTFLVFYKTIPLGWYDKRNNTLLVHSPEMKFIEQTIQKEMGGQSPVIVVE